MRSPCRAFSDPVDVRPTGVAARPGGLAPRLAGRLARTATGVDRVVVTLFAVTLFAGVFLAVVFLAGVFLAVVFLAVGFFAVGFFAIGFFAVGFLAAGFAVVLFALVLVPFLFVGMVASLVPLTLGSTCLGDHRRRGHAPWATVISAAEASLFGLLLFLARKFRTTGPRGAAPRVVESPGHDT